MLSYSTQGVALIGEEEKTCPQCGQTFQTTRVTGSKQKRFCSAECKENYWTDQRCPGRHDARVCRACGAQFKWEYKGQYYCNVCRAARERKKRERYEDKTCPQCGKEFSPERKSGKPSRFCCRACNIAWWSAHRDSPNRKAYSYSQCQLCGKEFRVYSGYSRKFCSKACAALGYTRGCKVDEVIEGYKKPPRVSLKSEALRLRVAGHRYSAIARSLGLSVNTVKSWCLRAGMGKPKTYESCVIPRRVTDPEDWLERLNALDPPRLCSPKQRQRVFLACGITKISGGVDVLCAVVEYRLKMDPYNGDIYAFCDWNHKRLKWIWWDGSGFCVGLRRMEYGVYPWPCAQMGKILELSEEEFSFLLSCTAPQKRAKNTSFA